MEWAGLSNSDSAVFNYFLIFEDKMFAVKLTNTIWMLVSVIQNIRFSRFNAPYVYWCQCKDFLPHCFKARFVLVTLKLIHDKHFKFLSTLLFHSNNLWNFRYRIDHSDIKEKEKVLQLPSVHLRLSKVYIVFKPWTCDNKSIFPSDLEKLFHYK